jgi:hypothetical protein
MPAKYSTDLGSMLVAEKTVWVTILASGNNAWYFGPFKTEQAAKDAKIYLDMALEKINNLIED